MPNVKANDIQLEYHLEGPANGEPLLCVHGTGAQLIQWPDQLREKLIAAGFKLIIFDNRDVGRSTHFDGVKAPSVADILAARRDGKAAAIPYSVNEMANDAAGLLGALRSEALACRSTTGLRAAFFSTPRTGPSIRRGLVGRLLRAEAHRICGPISRS